MTTMFVHPATEIPRDRWGRPLIVPADGVGKPVPYTRASTLAKTLDNKDALMKWKQRQVVLGMGLRPDLVALAKTAKADDKGKLGEIADTAMDAAASDAAANLGTALHSMTEQVDAGADPASFGPEYTADLTAYKNAMAEFTIVASELFVVTDEVQTAGTFDRLLGIPGYGTCVGDVKTGQHEPDYPHGATTQIAVYSRGHLYTPEKLRIGHLPTLGVNQEVGLLIHLPAGQGRCDLYLLDLNVGWALAQTAVAVRETFKRKDVIRKFTPQSPVSA
jgi:hypothetical protein